jgi:hypothetical protein
LIDIEIMLERQREGIPGEGRRQYKGTRSASTRRKSGNWLGPDPEVSRHRPEFGLPRARIDGWGYE